MMYLLKIIDFETILSFVVVRLNELRRSPTDPLTRSYLVLVGSVRDASDEFIRTVEKPW